LELRKKNNNLDYNPFVILFSFQEKTLQSNELHRRPGCPNVLGPVFKAIGTINRKCHLNSCCMETVWNRRALQPHIQYMAEWANQQFFFLPANTVIHKMFKHKYTQHYKKTVTLYCIELQHGAQFSFNQATC